MTLEKTADQAQTAWREEREQQAMFNKDRDDRSDNGTTTSFLDISGTRYR